MIDQAAELRKLVLRAMREHPISAGPPPRLIVLTGGKDGVGVTTIAVNLAVALAEQGSRVVIVDADIHRSDVATLCGLRNCQDGISFVEARRDIHEVLHPGPAGIQIVPGLRMPHQSGHELLARSLHDQSVGEISYERLQRQLSTLGRHADIVVLDLGSDSRELLRRFSATADDVLIVTTPDNVAVMDAYARIKTDLGLAAKRSLRLVVNLASDESHAGEVHGRIDSSCRKFLDVSIAFAGHVPHDGAASRGAASSMPFVLGEPMSPAARAIDTLASKLVAASNHLRIA